MSAVLSPIPSVFLDSIQAAWLAASTKIHCITEVEAMPQSERVFVRFSFEPPGEERLSAGVLMLKPPLWNFLQASLQQWMDLTVETVPPEEKPFSLRDYL